MHRTLVLLVGCGLALASGPGSALMCYQIVDRTETLIYQDTFPPVDLSDAGAPQRDQMRVRGEQMIVAESEKCPRLEFFTGNAGSPALSIDAVVAGMNARSLQPSGAAGPTGAAGVVSPSGKAMGPAPAARAAPSQPAPRPPTKY